jgi:hypothetical protein
MNQVFTSKGMIDADKLERSVVWEFTPETIVFKEQYHEIATGELVRSGCDVYMIPQTKTNTETGVLNG